MMPQIQEYIWNIPKELEVYRFVIKKEDIPLFIERTNMVYKWLKENIGKYELLKDIKLCI